MSGQKFKSIHSNLLTDNLLHGAEISLSITCRSAVIEFASHPPLQGRAVSRWSYVKPTIISARAECNGVVFVYVE